MWEFIRFYPLIIYLWIIKDGINHVGNQYKAEDIMKGAIVSPLNSKAYILKTHSGLIKVNSRICPNIKDNKPIFIGL